MLGAANKDSCLSARAICFKASRLLRLQTLKSASFFWLLFFLWGTADSRGIEICCYGLERGRVDGIASRCRRSGSNYCKTEGDANWVIKDFNLKGWGEVISAVRDDRRVYLQQKTYIVQHRRNELCDVYQLNTDSFSTKGSFLPVGLF